MTIYKGSSLLLILRFDCSIHIKERLKTYFWAKLVYSQAEFVGQLPCTNRVYKNALIVVQIDDPSYINHT